MARWMTLLLVAVATTAVLVESKAIPAEPISMMLDSYGNPIIFLREKRTPVSPYPQRAMMFTGYYRPVRRSQQAGGVFAQGNAVSGGAYFSGMHSAPHLKNGPEPIEEPEISSAEAEASPEEPVNAEEEEAQQEEHPQQHPHLHHHQQEEEAAEEEPQRPQEEEHHGEGHHHHQQDEEHHNQEGGHSHHEDEHHHVQHDEHHGHHAHDTPQESPESAATESPFVTAAVPQTTEVAARPPKRIPPPKKGKKTPVVHDEEDDEDDDDDEEDEPVVPFIPFKGNRRRQQYPNLNNFFPMVFSFPGGSTRAGSSGSPPGTVTAIANSYSTSKGGVASSIAKAYGGTPNGKKRRTSDEEE